MSAAAASEPSYAEIKYFMTLQFRLRHRLAVFAADWMFRADTPVQKLVTVVTCSVIVMKDFAFAHETELAKGLNRHLRKILEGEGEGLWEGFPELMLWACLQGGYAAGTKEGEREWFLFGCARGIGGVGGSGRGGSGAGRSGSGGKGRVMVDLGWEGVREMLKGFFFVDRIHGEKYRAVWEEVRLLARFSRNLEGR